MSSQVASATRPVDNKHAQLKRLQALLRDVFSAQQFLIEARQLRKEQWELISLYFQKKEYLEVVEERSGNHKCGFCFCDNPTATIEEQQLARWSALRGEDPTQRTLFDPRPPDVAEVMQFSKSTGDFIKATEKLFYCSKNCFVESRLLAESLDTAPLNLRKFPWSNFTECLQAMKKAITEAKEEKPKNDVLMTDIAVSQRDLRTVKEELDVAKVDRRNIQITENMQVEEPSDDFSIIEGVPLPTKAQKMELPFYSTTNMFISELITEKTKKFLKTLKQQNGTLPGDEFSSYSFQPLSSSFKRFESLEKMISKEFSGLQACFGFDREIMSFISKILWTMKYSNAVKTTKKFSMVITLVFIFVACRYNVKWQEKLDQNLATIKRLLRVDCSLRRGQFESFLSNFDI